MDRYGSRLTVRSTRAAGKNLERNGVDGCARIHVLIQEHIVNLQKAMSMNWASSEVVGVFTFLLPGFIAAAIFYALTSYPRPGAFDRVVVALIFTAIGQTIVEYGLPIFPGDDAWKPLASIIVAVALGLGFSTLSNADTLHMPLRWLRVTRETSYSSEWYSTFARLGDGSYIVLHLAGERRLYGYAEEWPGDPRKGHFRIGEPEWLDKDGASAPATGVSAILIPAEEVTMVEFLPVTEQQRT